MYLFAFISGNCAISPIPVIVLGGGQYAGVGMIPHPAGVILSTEFLSTEASWLESTSIVYTSPIFVIDGHCVSPECCKMQCLVCGT